MSEVADLVKAIQEAQDAGDLRLPAYKWAVKKWFIGTDRPPAIVIFDDESEAREWLDFMVWQNERPKEIGYSIALVEYRDISDEGLR